MSVGIGIELGASAVRAVLLERNGQRLTLRAAHEIACDTADPDALSRGCSELRQLLSSGGPVVLGVPGTSAILAAVTPLIAVPQRAVLAVQFELQQLLPFDLADAAWHYHWLSNGVTTGVGSRAKGEGQGGVRPSALRPPPSAPPGTSQAVVAAMRRSLLDERLACCRQAGFAVKAVAVNPMAALNAWDVQRGMPAAAQTATTTLLLLHDARSADWVVRTAASLRVVPVAAESAERFIEELASSWESIRTQPEPVPMPVWVSGAAELVARLQAQAAGLGVPFQPLELSKIVDVGAGRSVGSRSAAALGLALQAVDAAPVALNLLEGVQRETQEQLVSRSAVVLSAVLALAACGFGLSGMIESRSQRLQLLQALERREKLYQTLRPEIRRQLQRQQRIEQRGAQLEHLDADASTVTRLLGQLASTLPDSVWLTSLECSKDGLLSGMLEGRATSFQEVTQFIDRLKSLAGMTTVKTLSTSVKTDEATGKEVIAFSVQIQRPLVGSEEAPESPKSEVGSRQSKKERRR